MSFSETNPGGTVSGDFSKLEALIKELGKKYYVDIGILGENNQTVEGGLTLAGIGAVHEFGTDKAGRGNKTVIPERSFIRMPLETGQSQIEAQIEPKIKDGTDIKQIFKLIGIAGEARIKEAFDTSGFGTWKPNSDITINGSKPNKDGVKFIKGKKSDKPLIDEGTLKDGIMSKPGVNQ